MTDFSRRNLSNDPVEIYQEKDTDGLIEYRWRIKDPKQKVLCSGTKKYFSKEEMNKEILLVKALATDIENYEIKKAKSGKFYYNLVNPEITDTKDEARIIARRLDYFDTENTARNAVRQFISFIKKVKPNEGMYLIEHILLRPDEVERLHHHRRFVPAGVRLRRLRTARSVFFPGFSCPSGLDRTLFEHGFPQFHGRPHPARTSGACIGAHLLDWIPRRSS